MLFMCRVVCGISFVASHHGLEHLFEFLTFNFSIYSRVKIQKTSVEESYCMAVLFLTASLRCMNYVVVVMLTLTVGPTGKHTWHVEYYSLHSVVTVLLCVVLIPSLI